MNNIIILSILGVITVFSLIYMNIGNTDTKEKISYTTSENEINKHQDMKKKSIEIVYLEDTEDTTKEEITTNIKVQKEKEENKFDHDIISSNKNVKDINEYIIRKQLKPININKETNAPTTKKYTIYSNVTLEEAKILEDNNKNNMLPPVAPSIATVTFSTGESHTLLIPNEIQSQAQEIIVVKNNDNGDVEESVTLKQTDTESPMQAPIEEEEIIKIDTPPSIGQSN